MSFSLASSRSSLNIQRWGHRYQLLVAGPRHDQRNVPQMPDLNELPHHEQLKGCAHPARGHNEGIRREHEVVQAREEGLVLEVLVDERVRGLLERESTRIPSHCCPTLATASFAPSFAACMSPGPPPVTMSQPISARARAKRFTSA